MPTERKIEVVADLTDKLSRMQLALVADYRGLTVAEMRDLRSKLRESGGEMIIAKNTLIKRAAQATGNEGLDPLLAGPTALTLAYDDVPKVAKTLEDYIKASQNKISVRGGMLGTSVLGEDDLSKVARMPRREQILAQIVSGVQSPLTGVVGVVNATITNVLYTLQARIDQLQPSEEGSTAETA
jgi:large subunit ribosomal protein L10